LKGVFRESRVSFPRRLGILDGFLRRPAEGRAPAPGRGRRAAPAQGRAPGPAGLPSGSGPGQAGLPPRKGPRPRPRRRQLEPRGVRPARLRAGPCGTLRLRGAEGRPGPLRRQARARLRRRLRAYRTRPMLKGQLTRGRPAGRPAPDKESGKARERLRAGAPRGPGMLCGRRRYACRLRGVAGSFPKRLFSEKGPRGPFSALGGGLGAFMLLFPATEWSQAGGEVFARRRGSVRDLSPYRRLRILTVRNALKFGLPGKPGKPVKPEQHIRHTSPAVPGRDANRPDASLAASSVGLRGAHARLPPAAASVRGARAGLGQWASDAGVNPVMPLPVFCRCGGMATQGKTRLVAGGDEAALTRVEGNCPHGKPRS
jgi:hypothetical protein